MIKSDGWIIQMARERGLIEPFEPKQVRQIERGGKLTPVISFGTSSYGYDIRVARKFRVLDPALGPQAIVDPKQFNLTLYRETEADEIVLPAHALAIVQSVEHFRIPRDVLALCQGKSTYARCGIHVAITPLEPEWEGTLTFSISNHNPCPARIYAGEGIAQVMFFRSDEPCLTSYADKQGKYQKQSTITPPRV
jgi:dCTP deaminase